MVKDNEQHDYEQEPSPDYDQHAEQYTQYEQEHSETQDAGPPWRTVSEIGKLPNYAKGLIPVTSGFGTLDDALDGGFRPESMYIIAGRTGTAKSTLALNIARKTALSDYSTLLFKLEESPTEAVWRMHAASAGVPLKNLMDANSWKGPDRQALVDAWYVLRTIPLRISDARHIDAIERIAKQHADQGGRLVVIDQLSMIEIPDANVGYERATTASNRLRLLARYLQIPILLIAQVNRPASRATESRLTCNDLRDSGALENDASAVLLIDSVKEPDVYRFESDPLTLELLVAKNRYGPITRKDDPHLKLAWWPRCCRIEDPTILKGTSP